MKSGILLPLLAATAPASAAETAPKVGIVADPCAEAPPMPDIVADYLVRARAADAAGEPLPPRSEEGLAIYTQWQRDLTLNDYAGLCRYAEANRALGPATPHRVVFMGIRSPRDGRRNSPGSSPETALGRGIGGQTTTQMVARFRADVIALEPRVVHIMAGVNDIAGNGGPTTLDRIEANISTMVDLAEAHGIQVVLGSVLPARRFDWRPGIDPVQSIAALNTRLRSLAARKGLVYADYYSALDNGDHGLSKAHAEDGVHPTAAGYAVMRSIAEQALAAALSRPS